MAISVDAAAGVCQESGPIGPGPISPIDFDLRISVTTTATPPGPQAVPTAGEALSGRAWAMLLVLCGALFLDALDVSMKGVALPAIGADLGLSTSSLQWVVSGYVLGFGGFMLLGGRAADLLGRRRMFLGSLLAFLVTSALGGLATSGELLVATRFLTGVSAAFSAPAGLSIITTSFAEGPARNRALAVYTATGASGFAFGLVVGGLLTDVSWRWVFFLPVLLACLTLAGAVRLIPRAPVALAERRGFDVAGAVTVTAAMLLLVFTLAQAPEWGWASGRTLASFAGVVALLAAFGTIESRTADPLLRLGLLRSGPVVRANVGALVLVGSWVGALFVLTLYLQDVRGWSAFATGLAVAPSGVVVAVLAPRIAAPLVGRYGTTPVIIAGFASFVAAYAVLLALRAETPYLTVLLPAFLLVGLGFTLTYGPLNVEATSGVPAADQGVAGGLVNTSLQLGAAILLAAVTAVHGAFAGDGATTSATVDGLRAALVVPLVASLVGLTATATGLRAGRRPGTA
jgi:MFS family permease